MPTYLLSSLAHASALATREVLSPLVVSVRSVEIDYVLMLRLVSEPRGVANATL
jgi:hypothetical protein